VSGELASARTTGFVDIVAAGRALRVEYAWVGPGRDRAAPIVFLHEGLGSVAMWRDFPERLCAAIGRPGFVYSRPGYGRSTPRPAGEHWAVDFMHHQAHEVLPAVLAAAGIDTPWLFGHSDGGSIALLHAARHAVAGVVAVAPHLFVEDVSVASIARAQVAYESGGLRERLARYHDDVDSAFFGWNDAWLSPTFREWNIERDIAAIAVPLLAVQGEGDEYGTLEQVRALARRSPQAQLRVIPACGHSPHRDQPEVLIDAVCSFLANEKGPSTR